MRATTTATIPGLDPVKLDEFNKYAEANPNDVVLGLEATTIWEGHGVENLGKIGRWQLAGQVIDKPTRDFSIQFGAWKEVEEQIGVEGAHDRIEPMEAALAGMASCVSTAITLNAAREGVSFDGLEVTAKATVDPRVLLGAVPAEEAESCLQRVDVEIKVDGDLSSEQKEKVIEMARRSPVHALIKGENTINERLVDA
ncbi:MAG: OsmC family protein [Gaiellales bacterium]